MPAKFLQALGEERRPELHRQMGCVTGILQAFDRRYLLATPHAQKRLLPSGHALSSSPNIGEEREKYSPQIVLEKNLSKNWNENQKTSIVEPSHTSYSSSSCSSFSSLDGNRSTQQDLSSMDRMLFPERPFKSSPKLKSSSDSDHGPDHPDDPLTKPPNISSAQFSQPTLGIRHLVKDSIYRDSNSLSVRSCNKEAVKDHQFNFGEPPRSMDEPPMNAVHGKSKVTMDINESLRVLAKLREVSWNPPEAAQHPRLSYDAPRFSYDGKEAVSKLREVPRLSLDIKEGPLWNCETDLRPKTSMNTADRTSNISQEYKAALETQQEQPACKRLPSVVAKLMGLEELPEPTDNNTTPSHASKAFQERKQEPVLSPLSISSHNEPAPRQQRNLDTSMRNVPNSRFPVETAPWKQQERIVLPRKLPKGSKGAHGREQSAASVYSEIEKRLKDLDFQQSNKDLRALKQILDSMQAKGLLQSKKREEASMPKLYAGNCDVKEVKDANLGLNRNMSPKQMPEAAPSLMEEERNVEGSFKSPIVIMKPAKSANLSSDEDSSVIPLGGLSDLPHLRTSNCTDKKKGSVITTTGKEQPPKSSPRVPAPQLLASSDKRSNGRNEESSKQKPSLLQITENSSRGKQLPRDNIGSSQKHKHSTSPRLLQKKHDAERRARPLISSPELNKNQRHSADRSPLDTVSPRSKTRRKPTQAQQRDDGQHNRVSSRTRSLNQQGNEVSTRSDGSLSVASELDVEVTSADRSAQANISHLQLGNQTPSGRNPQKVKIPCNANTYLSSMDVTETTPERPSPISVLDSSFDQEDLFPTSKTSNASGVDDEHHPSEESWKPSGRKPTKLITQSKNSKLANVANLLQKLQQLSVNKDEEAPPFDHIAFLCETQSPDHRYVSEVLLASGLLMKDLSAGQTGLPQIQLHTSGYLINPDLFLVLEQRKSGWISKHGGIHQNRSITKSDPNRAHRKLMFDTVNELLLQKFEKETAVLPPSSVTRVRDPPAEVQSGQQLVKVLCSEIEELKTERSRICQEDSSVIPDAEILHRLEGWTNFSRELPGMALEIERSIFKELVDEVVHGESADSLQAKAGRRRRRLFA